MVLWAFCMTMVVVVVVVVVVVETVEVIIIISIDVALSDEPARFYRQAVPQPGPAQAGDGAEGLLPGAALRLSHQALLHQHDDTGRLAVAFNNQSMSQSPNQSVKSKVYL